MDLSKVPMLAERQVVAAAIEKFNDICDRRYAATRENYAKQEAIRDELRERHRIEEDAALADLRLEEAGLASPFDKELDELQGYPNVGERWMMFDDWCGVYRCRISGLPLREDDDIVEYGDGHVLAVLQEDLMDLIEAAAERRP